MGRPSWSALAGLIAAALLAVPSGARAASISVLEYNVNGLFRGAAESDPGARTPMIGWLANHYDVVLLQEDFEYHDAIAAQMIGKRAALGNGIGSDPRRVAVKVLLAPFGLLIPHFWPPYGSGLSSFVRDDLAIAGDVDRHAYGICDGWFGARADCWANKGWLRTGVRTEDGLEIDFYDTHLDAGSGAGSAEARRRQLVKLAAEIEKRPAERAVVVAGDLNLAYDRPEDRVALTEFRRRLGLADSGAGPELPSWRERGYILQRDGERVRLEVEQAGEAPEFVNVSRSLSDHPALFARFRVLAREGNDRS